MDERLLMLQDLTGAPGVPGYEGPVRGIIRKYLDGLADIEVDGIGSIICRKQGASDRPRIMLAGHMDEIGFMVTLITKEGFLKFQTLGGWWSQVMLAQRVVVKTCKGDVTGIVGSKPQHILTDEERKKVVERTEHGAAPMPAGSTSTKGASPASSSGYRHGTSTVTPESSTAMTMKMPSSCYSL
jgi:endoglucanase